MPKQDVMNAFEKLEKNNDALLGKEKEALQRLNTTDIMEAKNDLSKKKFEVKLGDGSEKKEITLDQAIKGYESATKTINFEGKKYPVKSPSDLAAAMQLYLIANGESVSTNRILTADSAKGIDGSIGSATRAAMTSYKTKNPDKPNGGDKIDKIPPFDNLGEIFSKNLYKYFGNDKDKYKDSYKIFDNYNKLSGNFDNSVNPTKIIIPYDSQQDFESKKSKTVTIAISEFKNQDGTVDVAKLVNSIKKAITSKEQKLRVERRAKAVKDGINEYTETSITDPVVKEWFKNKKPDFQFAGTIKREGKGYFAKIKNKNDANNTRIVREIPYEKLLPDGIHFSVGNYASELVKIYKPQAIKYAKDLIKTAENSAEMGDITNRIQKHKGIIDRIDSYGAGYAPEFKNEKAESNNQIKYLEKLKVLNEVKYNISKLTDNTQQLTQLQKVVTVYNVTINGMIVKQIDYNTNMRKIFKKAGHEQEYVDTVSKLVEKVFATNVRKEINK